MKTKTYTAKNGSKIIVTALGRILMTSTGTGKTEMLKPFMCPDGEAEEYTDTKLWWARFVTGQFRQAKIGADGERPSTMENYRNEPAISCSAENGYEAIRSLMLKAVEIEMKKLPGYEEHYGVSI